MAKLVVALARIVGRTNPDRWAGVAAFIMRRVGPRLGGHRHALEQLALAFPEKSTDERQRIAIGMWDNLARTVVEYTQLEKLWHVDLARPERSRVIRTTASIKVWEDIKTANRPTLHFSLDIANWELAATAGVGSVRCLIPFRRLKNETMNDELVRVRVAAGVTPLAAGPSMISQIKREFGPGDGLGMLIDQRYVHGIDVTFFGRPTRRPDGRFGYEIVPVEPVRDARGRVDAHATTQLFAPLMERWIREYPEQWMWLHGMWR